MRNEVNEELKPIIVKTEDGDEYTLEFSRQSVVFTNKQGFDITKIESNAEEMIPILWYGAFRMHHQNVSRQKTDKLYEDMGGLTSAAMERLVLLYLKPRQAMFRDEEDANENPPKVTLQLL